MPRRKRKRSPRAGARRSIYLLPNLFTTGSLFAGFYAVVASINGEFILAAWAIVAALFCDGLDGKVARATNTTSRFGVEYDSLADLVAFGVAPAILVFLWGLKDFGRLGWVAAFIFVACGALRLARFNVQVDKVGTSHFVGLPIPAAACMVSTTVLFFGSLGYGSANNFIPLLFGVLGLSFLMVSNIHYLSFKELAISRLKSLNGLIVMLLFFLLLAIHPQAVGFGLLAAYVILGPPASYFKERRTAKQQKEQDVEHSPEDKLPLDEPADTL